MNLRIFPGGLGSHYPRCITYEYAHFYNTILEHLHMSLDLKAVQASLEKRNAQRIASIDYQCQHCAKRFHRNRPWQVFCSDTCRLESYRVVTQRQYLEMEAENQLLLEENKLLKARIAELES